MSTKQNRDPIPQLIGQGLNAGGYDVIDLVPIPARGDRLVRIRTLEEALEDFESADTESFLVHVRIRENGEKTIETEMVTETLATQDSEANRSQNAPTVDDSLHLPNGKLNVPFLLKNGQLLFEAREYDLARNIFSTILNSGERSGLAHLWLARCFEAEGNTEQAEKNFTQSLAYTPSLDAYQRLAAIHIRKKQDQQAAELMERALNIKTLAPSIRFELHKACGNCWLRSDAPKQAEEQYKKALEIQPSNDSVLANLGALCLQIGRADEASKHFQIALATNARNEKALSGLGSCALARGDKRAAHDYFAKVLEIDLNNPNAIYHLVKCAYELKTYATAARVVADYVQIAPVNTNLLYSLAGLQFHLGRIADSQNTLNRVLELNANHAGAQELKKMIESYGNS